jgi:Chaperone of endosialidase
MAVPYTFATATSSIPLSQLDANFATAITLGNTAVYLGNTTTSIGNLTLTNTTISSVAVTFPNSYLANSSVTLGTTNVSLGGTATTLANLTLSNVTITGGTSTATQNLANVTGTLAVANGGTGLTTLTSGYIPYGNGTSAFSSSSGLTYNGSTFSVTGAISATSQVSGTSGSFSAATGSLSLTNASYGNIVSTNTLYIDTSSGAINIRPAASTIATFTTTGLGIGTSSPSTPLHIQGTSTLGSVYQLRLSDNTGANLYIGGGTGGAQLQSTGGIPLYLNYGGNNVLIGTGGSGGNVGIGTASPSTSLEIYKASVPYLRISDGTGFLNVGVETTDSEVSFFNSYSGYKWYVNYPTVGMRLDSSGNLGLGVTPSAWYASYKAFQLGQGGALSSYNSLNITNLSNNWYPNSAGTDKYITADYATNLQQYQGQFKFFVAPTGSAGGTVTFTQAMTLDNSGNLLVGTTSAIGKVTINQDLGGVGDGIDIKDTGSAYGTGAVYIKFLNNAGSVAGSIQHTASTVVVYNATSDERLKENIVDAPNALDKVLNIPVRSYDWKEDKHHVDYGFIAQELEKIYVEPVNIGSDDEKLNPWGVDYGRLTPLLVKAIQELSAEVNQLKAKVGI